MNRTAYWHEMISKRNIGALDELLADNATFHSPVVHTPQEGKPLVKLYLSSAFSVLLNDSFSYVREVESGTNTILEFQLQLNGISVNGVDMIEWDDNGQIKDFKVMLRPLKGMQQVQIEMAKMLEKAKSKG
ncbi:nuclear transport factor 2 family protein [Ferrimonas lipolytica]|uniref:Nuclear transport factor 2 family protein n=1 Tax=Ferrimonas lipolytica TaxID=2724191 RepID=A0A6H1UCS7_9GAMM|nr:nuclear transport factor 2 family protein [Ferrimonas lipolytica]QIZ76390.1 nuclear transport factor 2 family protein [Ferrimonas lipolytica]